MDARSDSYQMCPGAAHAKPPSNNPDGTVRPTADDWKWVLDIREKEVHNVRAPRGRAEPVVRRHFTTVNGVAFFPYGKRIAATSWEGVAYVWRAPR